MGFIWSIAKFAAKVGIVAGAIKLSIDNDVWSLKTEEGCETYEKLKKYIIPGTIVYREKLPSTEEVHLNVGSKWNDNVNSAFTMLNAAPAKLNSGVNSLYRSAQDQIQGSSSA